MYVLGIDPSLAATGVVLVHYSPLSGITLEKYGVYGHSIGRDMTSGLRQREILGIADMVTYAIDDMLAGYPAAYENMVLEDFSYGQTSWVAYDLGLLGGIIRNYIYNIGDLCLVNPASAKGFVCMKRVKSAEAKKLAVEFYNERLPNNPIKPKKDAEAIADAFVVAYMRICQEHPELEPDRMKWANKVERVE